MACSRGPAWHGLAAIALVLACYARAAAGKIAMPGDPHFWVKLMGMESGEGIISPAFTPGGTDYTLQVERGDTKTVHLNLVLDLSKYHPMHCPKITVDGKILEYTPLNQVVAKIELGEHLGPLEKVTRIKLSDPKTQAGGFLGMGGDEHAHEYAIRIVKPPQFDKVARATSIIVRDSRGVKVEGNPPFDPASNSQSGYEYTLPSNETRATLEVTCPQIGASVTQLYDMAPVQIGAKIDIDFTNSLLSRTVAECRYSDPVWAKNAIERSYNVDILRHVDNGVAKKVNAELVMLPEYGFCTSVSSEHADLKPAEGTLAKDPAGAILAHRGFVCRVHKDHAILVATFSTSLAKQLRTSLISRSTGARVWMKNALPVTLPMTRARQYFHLNVQAGDVDIDFPVAMIFPASCSTMQCPERKAHRPVDPFVAKGQMCETEECSSEADVARCCVPAGVCTTLQCPDLMELRPNAAETYCKEASCTLEVDEGTCCNTITTRTTTSTSTSSRTSSTSTETTSTATSTASMPDTTSTTLTLSSRTATTTTFTATSTTTTQTSTSSSTTSTTMICVESDIVWMPLDMVDEEPTVEDNILFCQARCARTKGCEHFSFWRKGSHCHLQDGGAKRREFGFGFESGPPECLPSNTVTTTTTYPLALNMQCMQKGIVWSPMLGAPGYFHGSREAVTLSCQSWCSRTPGCVHFIAEFSQNMCRLAGVDAQPLPDLPGTISGPPSCAGVYEELQDFILKRYSSGAYPQSAPVVAADAAAGRRPAGAATTAAAAAAGCCAGLVVAGMVAAAAVAARRRASLHGATAAAIAHNCGESLVPAFNGRVMYDELAVGESALLGAEDTAE